MRAAEFCEQVRSTEVVRLHVFFTGYVQGVGFRWTMQTFARDEGVTGWVKNLPDRITVEAELQGTGEGRAFTAQEQQDLVRLCAKGNRELLAIQREILKR